MSLAWTDSRATLSGRKAAQFLGSVLILLFVFLLGLCIGAAIKDEITEPQGPAPPSNNQSEDGPAHARLETRPGLSGEAHSLAGRYPQIKSPLNATGNQRRVTGGNERPEPRAFTAHPGVHPKTRALAGRGSSCLAT